MLRLVDRANESAGAAGTRDALLYSCDALNSSGVPDSFEDNHGVPTRAADSLHVNLRMWHPLAPAFTRAWTAVQSRSGDASAGQIIATFQRAKEEFGRWVGAHSSADSNARDAALNRIAAELGLLELLRKYESGKAAG
jgi:hypothetical protein